MSPLILFYYLFLAAVWGASFMFMRVGVPEFGAYAFSGLRVGIAGLVLLPFLLRRKRLEEIYRYWPRLIIIGLISMGIPFTLFSFALQTMPAGVAAVVNAAVPMLTGLIAHVFFHDKQSRQQWLGLLIGLTGVIFLVTDRFSSQTGIGSLWPLATALLACLCYAAGGNLSRHYLSTISPMTIASTGLLASAVMMLPLVIIYFPEHSISLAAWSSALAIALLSTAAAMVIFYHVLKIIGPTKISTVTLVVPIFGLFWGVVLLDETTSYRLLIGTGIILFGTALSIFKRH